MEKEVITKIKAALACRIKLDCLVTDNKRFEKKAITFKTVQNTWTNLLLKSKTHFRSWRKINMVLMSIE